MKRTAAPNYQLDEVVAAFSAPIGNLMVRWSHLEATFRHVHAMLVDLNRTTGLKAKVQKSNSLTAAKKNVERLICELPLAHYPKDELLDASRKFSDIKCIRDALAHWIIAEFRINGEPEIKLEKVDTNLSSTVMEKSIWIGISQIHQNSSSIATVNELLFRHALHLSQYVRLTYK